MGMGMGIPIGSEEQLEDVTVESEDYAMEDTERMQLNPSTDLYDDDDEDDDDDDDDDGLDEDDDGEVAGGGALFADDANKDDDDIYDEDDEEPEQLPDPKSLVSPPTQAGAAAAAGQPVEEEDMGYDEDDERIALERQRTARPRIDEEHFVNEEGSGAGFRPRFKPHNNHRQSQLEKIRKKLLTESHRDQKVPTVAIAAASAAASGASVDLRESSGHFANDDEDGEDNDDGTDDEYADNGEAGGTGFFGSQGRKGASSASSSANHYFRKNTNDAIKIISTPLGKVGIVYQQTTGQEDKQVATEHKKPASTFTDFDALSPDPESSHRFPSPHPKITPVLTPDGKVALLYRGDSESSKYEPIRNMTHKFGSNKNDAAEQTPTKTSPDNSDDSADDSTYTDSEDESSVAEKPAPAVPAKTAAPVKPELPEIVEPPAHVPPGGSFIIRPTSDSLLPMINRPLSEVLGIKKNQFQETRVRDQLPMQMATEATPRSLLAQSPGESSTLHFLTKVNLADYPTSTRTQQQLQQQQQQQLNRDFDFSRDNTMLDERSRIRELEKQREREREHNEATGKGGATEAHTIANEELLSKTEVVNLAIIPHFDEDLERLQRLHEGGTSRRHHRARHRHKQTEEDLSGIHCIMQVMMGIAAVSTVFGMLGTFFKQRILDQLRMMHW